MIYASEGKGIGAERLGFIFQGIAVQGLREVEGIEF